MIEVKFSGDTAADVLQQMGGFVAQALVAKAKAATEPVTSEARGGKDEPKVEKAEGAKAEEPPKAEGAKAEEPPKAEGAKAERKSRKMKDKSEETPATDDAKPASIEDLRAALMRLAKSKGDDAVFELLSEYKAKNASTVPEDKRAEVIAKIDEMVGE